jgi:GTP-binding protein
MKEQWEYIPRYFVTSAVKALGRKDLLSYIDEVNLNFNPAEPRVFL